MKTMLSLLISITFFVNVNASNNKYHLNEEQIETAFAQSEDISMAVSLFSSSSSITNTSIPLPAEDNTQLIAGIIALAQFFLAIGWLVPVHRFILGTNGQLVKIWGLYCITISGCGVLLLVDGILLLLDESKSKYLNNPKFIMWAK